MIESLLQLYFHGGLVGTTWLQPVLRVERKAFISIAALRNIAVAHIGFNFVGYFGRWQIWSQFTSDSSNHFDGVFSQNIFLPSDHRQRQQQIFRSHVEALVDRIQLRYHRMETLGDICKSYGCFFWRVWKQCSCFIDHVDDNVNEELVQLINRVESVC